MLNAILGILNSILGIAGIVIKRKNDPDMIAAKNAEVQQGIEEAATKQEQAEEQGDKPIEIK